MDSKLLADRHQSAEWKARKKAYQEDLARWQKLSQPGQAKRTRSERTHPTESSWRGTRLGPISWHANISGLSGLQTVGRLCQTGPAVL
jgi:hypothetical protein